MGVIGAVPEWASYGSGDGYGYGYGSGSGSGYGSGDVSKLYSKALLDAAVGGDRASALRGSGATLAYWRSNKEGRPCNGGYGEPVAPGTIHEESGRTPCERGMLHATYAPWKWKGERLWVVALWNAVEVDEDKLAATKREIIAEVQNFCQRES